MLCQRCGQRPATAQYTQIMGGVKTEYQLCSQCASELTGGHSFPSILTSMLGLWDEPALFHTAEDTCPGCGKTREELRQSGRPGCGECYLHFRDLLSPYIKTIHGADQHTGTTPAGLPVEPKEPTAQAKEPDNSLQAQLKRAVEQENYELAAKLRDQIRAGEDKQ